MAPVTDTLMNISGNSFNEKGSTLPRNLTSSPLEHVPQQNKSATLSKLLRITKDESSSSPLKALREIGKPRLKILPSTSGSINSTTFLLDNDCENPCETPSYMASAQGNFPLEPVKTPPPKVEAKPIERKENALPLPPRDRSTLQLNLNQKRHVRKYPLIIPAMATQRTLNKINQTTPVDEKPITPTPSLSTPNTSQNVIVDDDDDDDVFEDLKKETKISQEFDQNVNNHYGMIKAQNYTKDFIENNFPYDTRTYQNIEDFQKRFSSHDEADTASLHFESILEDEKSAKKISDDMVDGCFELFDGSDAINKSIPSTSGSSNNTSNNNKQNGIVKSTKKFLSSTATTSSIEVKKIEFSQKYPKYKMPRNELASNALFNKIKESVEMASMTDGECEVELDTASAEDDDDVKACELKKSINHVSCEDLLDFSVIPKGPQRGSESDEVRIMIKHFGSKVTLERCLLTLDFINWDLQKAIKLCKLQNLHPNQSLQDCLEQLEPHWDLNLIAKQQQQQ